MARSMKRTPKPAVKAAKVRKRKPSGGTRSAPRKPRTTGGRKGY